MGKLYSRSLRTLFFFVLSTAFLTESFSQTDITLGTGTSAASTNAFVATSTTTNRYSYNYTIYSAADIIAAGGFSGLISKLAWQKAGTGEYTSNDAQLKIYLKHVTFTQHTTTLETWASVIAGATLVYSSNTFSWPTGTGFKEVTLQAPFVWNGSDNLAVLIDWYRPTAMSSDITWQYTTVTNSNKWRIGTAPLTDMNQVNSSRANMRITLNAAAACTAPPTPGTTTSDAPASICVGTPVHLSLSGSSIGTGISYQLQSSPTSGGTYTNVGTSQTSFNFNTTPGVTSWYRIAVTCSGNTQFSTPVQVVVNPSFPAGTYTINAGAPTGGTNFHSFNDAVNAILCGVSGPVIFNVVPGSGPYNEQVAIPQINSMSVTNTVRFNGNGNTLSFASSNTNARYVVLLDGADYFTFDSLVIDASGGTYGFGIQLTNEADHNTITKCTVKTTDNSTSTNFAGIVISGSLTSATSTGDNASFTTIRKNTINGGYYPITVNGESANYGLNNIIDSNDINNGYFYNVYASYQENLVVRANDIKRTVRTNGTTFYGIYLISGLISGLIEGNRIHNPNDNATSQTNIVYGIYYNGPSDPGVETKIINNVVYNINNKGGTVYGLYLNDEGVRAYHNSISLDDQTATAGATRGIMVGSYSNVVVKNNVVSVTRTGSGTKYGIYASSTTLGLVENNNDIYVNAPSSFWGYWGADRLTINDWRTASGQGANSTDVNPQFASASSGNLYPNNTAIASLGAAVGVTKDIVGVTRDALTPTPGAYEIIAAVGIDMGVKSLLLPVQKSCYSSSENVTVTIRNYSASTINFASTPVTVNATVSGPNAQTFSPVIVNSGTLAPDDTLNVVITTNYNMTATGNYIFNASTSVAGDAGPLNNAMPPTTRVVFALDAGTAASNPPSYCVTGGRPKLSLTGSAGGSIQWQESSSSSGPWINVGTDSTSYTPAAAITATRYYRSFITCGSNSDTSNIVTVALSNPQVLNTIPVTRCGPGSVPLGATGSAGTTISWYTAASGGTIVGTGNTFNTPILSSTTTYYASAIQGSTSIVGLLPDGTLCGTRTGSTALDWPLRFNTTASVTLNSAVVVPQAAGTFTVALRNSLSATNLQTASFTFTAAQVGVPQQIVLGFSIPNPGNYQITNTTGGVLRIGTMTCPYPFTTTSGNFSIVGSATTSTSATNTTTYNSFFSIEVVEGCISPRVAVTATISPAPAFAISTATTICSGAIKSLNVTSPLANFNSYSWSPATNLFTDAAATTPYVAGSSASTVYVKNSVAGTYTYVATANNTSTSCQNIDSAKVTVLPSGVTINASDPAICVSGPTTLSLSPSTGYTGGSIQWYSSTNGGSSYTIIPAATGVNYTTPALTATTMFKAVISDAAGNICQQPTVSITVNNPQVLTTTPAARCGNGILTLQATSTPGSTINWYAASSGGAIIGTGNSFTTPGLSSTTTYYAAAFETSATGTAGRIAPLPASTGDAGDESGLVFTATKAFTLNSVDIYSASTPGGSVTIELTNSTGTVLQTAGPFVIPPRTGATTGSTPPATPITLNLGFSIQPGTGYRLRTLNHTGTLLRDNPIAPNFSYPIPIGIVGNITSGLLLGATTTTRYNYFYNWKFTTGCESPRTAVTATVSGNTTINSQPSGVSTCAGSTVTFSVNASGANLTYQWKKGTTNITNATSSSYTISGVTVADAGDYTVVITGLCGTLTSSVATLTVAATNTWTGNISNDWNNSSNWCGGVPTSVSDIVIPSGTPFQPTLGLVGEVHHLTINSGATLTLTATGYLNVYGNLSNSGTISASSGVIAFKGASNQNVSGLNAGTVLLNGAGITLTGNMTVGTSLILTSGHITLGSNNLILNGNSNGSVVSHVITNSTGSVISNNVNAAAVTIPVGPDASGYNPVTISGGQGRNYTVRVVNGINPSINNPNRAINRTWTILPSSAPSSPVNILLQYSDADANINANGGQVMEVGVHNGTSWNVISSATGVTPSGLPDGRQVGVTTSQFGSFVVANFGGITFPTAIAGIDADVTSIIVMPNPVQSSTTLRVQMRRNMKVFWTVVDENGRIVMTMSRQMTAGQNDISIRADRLASGVYHVIGATEKGKTRMVRFIKL